MRRFVAVGGIFLVVGLFLAVYQPQAKAPQRAYDVKILRDTYGVPHIYGKTDADAAYGLAYAHAEDDFATILEALLGARGRLSSVRGRGEGDANARLDYLVGLLRVWDTVNERYDKDLSPEVRDICQAYADGLNLYVKQHPGSAPRGILPITGKDVVAGFVFKGPFFFGLEGALTELFGMARKHEVSTKTADASEISFSLSNELPIGSNTFAVAPSRSADGATRININSHQPWEGVVAWYEAHMHSEEGMDIVGGVFPGAPVILHGHNRNLGWAHTVNRPDLIDIYVLDINPENPNQYMFDGQWRDFEIRQVPIKVKLWGPFSWTVKREALWSVYGPTLRVPHGVYSVRYSGMGDLRQVEQWYRMGKAANMDQWLDSMRMQSIPSLNCGYADKEGNILYLYNAVFPVRAEGYDWKKYLPGTTSETLWTEKLPFDKLPIVLNPASGFVQNCNSTPFKTTTGPENPAESNFSKTLGIETHMTNRALRAMELLSADESITEEEFFRYKYDMSYSTESNASKALEKMRAATPPADPDVKQAWEILCGWDLMTNPENTAAALGVLTIGPDSDGEASAGDIEKMMTLLAENAAALKAAHGRVDPPWSEVNRLRRGELNVGLGGGPDVLHAVYGSRIRGGKLEGLENGQIFGRAGDCYVIVPTWHKDGRLTSKSIHQYGSATLDSSSKHYADQVPLFASRQMKDVWMDESAIRANLEAEYRPEEKKARKD